jgi:hypothetical protein
MFRQLLLEDLLQLPVASGIARPAMMFSRALVLADKEMFREFRHYPRL